MKNDIHDAWLAEGIDAVIAPGFVFPAPPIKNPARLVPAISYTAAYNMVDFPAGSLPVTRVTSADEVCYRMYHYVMGASNVNRCIVLFGILRLLQSARTD